MLKSVAATLASLALLLVLYGTLGTLMQSVPAKLAALLAGAP